MYIYMSANTRKKDTRMDIRTNTYYTYPPTTHAHVQIRLDTSSSEDCKQVS